MSEVSTIFLDLFGTLMYLANETKPYKRLFADLGLQTPQELQDARTIALSEDFENLSQLVARIKPGSKIDLTSYEREVEEECASAKLYPETLSVLKELKRREKTLFLISNLASPYKKPFFDLGLAPYFSQVLFSCKEGLIKDDIKIYQRALQRSNVDPSLVIMFGDKTRNDVEGPQQVGIRGILVDRENEHKVKEKINSLEGVLQYC